MSSGIVFLLLALLNYVLDLSPILIIGFTITGICCIISDMVKKEKKEDNH